MDVIPKEKLQLLSVADMISTSHSISRIELFLKSVQRSVRIIGNTLKVIKTESHQNFAVTQACLKCFTGMTLKEYLINCYNALAVSKNIKTVPYLCASHVL